MLARMVFRVHLPHPQLSQRLVQLPGVLGRKVGTRVLVRHRGHVDQQPGISPAQLQLRGIEQVEQEIAENLVDRKRAQPPREFTGFLRGPLLFLPGAIRAISAHDSTPPTSASGWAECYTQSLAYRPGVMPNAALNVRVKWAWSAKPASNAVSASGLLSRSQPRATVSRRITE